MTVGLMTIFFIIILMILLSRIKCRCLYYLCDNGFVKIPFTFQSFLRLLGKYFLLLIIVKNSGLILRSLVGKLSFRIRRVNLTPKNVKKLFILDCFRIIGNLLCFIVSRFS